MMGRLPLFQRLTDTELERISGLAGERTVAAGEVIVAQWDGTREFYVVLEGSAAVRTAERHLDDIGPRDFFGEIAALDWRQLRLRAPGHGDRDLTDAAHDRLPGL